jgi:hypothetical protein
MAFAFKDYELQSAPPIDPNYVTVIAGRLNEVALEH